MCKRVLYTISYIVYPFTKLHERRIPKVRVGVGVGPMEFQLNQATSDVCAVRIKFTTYSRTSLKQIHNKSNWRNLSLMYSTVGSTAEGVSNNPPSTVPIRPTSRHSNDCSDDVYWRDGNKSLETKFPMEEVAWKHSKVAGAIECRKAFRSIQPFYAGFWQTDSLDTEPQHRQLLPHTMLTPKR